MTTKIQSGPVLVHCDLYTKYCDCSAEKQSCLEAQELLCQLTPAIHNNKFCLLKL